MVIDSSALVAIFLEEPEGARFDEAIAKAKSRLLPATCIFEARMILVTRRGERFITNFNLWLHEALVEIVSIDAELIDLATQAWLIYGKGRRHPAQLNFGDCMSYAVAKRSGEPLLFKGEDFSKTDIQAA